VAASSPSTGLQVPENDTWAVVWTESFDAQEPLVLTATEHLVLVSGGQTALQARAVDDGRLLWTAEVRAGAPPVVGDGLVFVSAADQLLALDAETGVERWRAGIPGLRHAPATGSGRVVVVTATEVAALDAATGDTLWRQPMADAAVAPVVSGDIVYVGSAEPRLAAFPLAEGAPARWSVRLETTPLAMSGSAAGVFFGGEDAAAYGYRAKDGRQLWRFPIHVNAIGPPVIANDRVHMAFFDNTVRAFDRDIGNLRWLEPLTDRPMAGLAAVGDQLVLPTTTGDLLTVSLADGTEGRLLTEPADLERAFESLAVGPGGATLFLLTSSHDAVPFRLTALRREAPEVPRS
jgi:outer membrane protein assembly factor BamB